MSPQTWPWPALAAGVALLCGAVPAPAETADWRLVWSDEFDGERIDPAHWGFEDDCWGGGNDERQCYTASRDNARIEEGHLVITARRQIANGPALPRRQRRDAVDPAATVTREFTSARLTTRGKAAWCFGRIEVRARLPQGQGLWPAIWLLPERDGYGPWAASGEIDLLEAVNLGVPCADCAKGREDRILGTLHFGKPWPGNAQASTTVHASEVLDGFHTFAIEWAADRITWQIDGRTYSERSAGEWWSSGSNAPGAPFDQPFHLILNLAVGGRLAEGRNLGGVDPAGFPKRLEIDWVRVWQKGDSPGKPAGERVSGKGH
ncbi:glycoside hydrolase family 16 protein [Novosphingobium flavum]|uniref:glycoside hydrolase family 16 protein n=1 Tax=Novosphingobium aerophilum TaxID=2839843 RepID=UPI0016397A98|nr:glycoside hydrolase family 16 protein [Novosphingobium aerophilum]MBC2662510.1 glycoside hydrolase family 16 protein [Novosphingobium aerophilum]